ncbi:MAG: hypothetical protein R3Y33_02690 [Clostridia bacterium]
MSMPNIPKEMNRPNNDELIIDLLKSIAMEEVSISHILNAQGEKAQELVKKYSLCDISFREMMEAFSLSNNIISSLIMKEWLLFSKLCTVINYKPFEQKPFEKIEEKTEVCENFLPVYGYDSKRNEKKCSCCIHKDICKNCK